MWRAFSAVGLAGLIAIVVVAPAQAGHVDLEAESEARSSGEAVYDLAGSHSSPF